VTTLREAQPPWWPDLTRIAHKKVDGLTQVVSENDSSKNYMLHIKRTGRKVTLNVNLACRTTLDLMFGGNYAEAVLEHENAHLNPTIHSYWEIPVSSNPLIADVRDRYYQCSHLLTEMVRDSIANALLRPQALQLFLEFEVRKIGDREERLPFVVDNLLWVTEVKLCADMRQLNIIDLQKTASAILGQSSVLKEIHVMAYTLFKKAWLGSEEGSKVVDCMVETRTLREYILQHPLTMLERMRE
jgi:hypothetical protein